MKAFLVYWVWPNPGGWNYEDSKVLAMFGVCLVLIVGSFLIRFWRRRLKNPKTRSLSSSWSSASFWFGLVALILVVSRVELIQFMSMRLLWAFWFLAAGLYVFFQILQFTKRHYTVLARTTVLDEREKYLPRRK